MTDFRKALADLVVAVGNHPDAMMATGDLHTPFMRACAALESSAVPEVACSGETPRTDALIASKPGLWREWKDSDFHALSQHAGQMERLAKRWQKIADQRAIEVADLKTSVPSPRGQKT